MNKKKLIAILALVCFMFTLVPMAAMAEESTIDSLSSDATWYVENETQLEIWDIADFMAFHNKVNGGTNFAGVTITLKADIDFKGTTLSPIGVHGINGNSYPFSGIFDGDDHTISKLNVLNTENAYGNFTGLFGHISGATIQDLVLDGCTFTADKPTYNTSLHRSVGAVAGNATNSTINGCVVKKSKVEVKDPQTNNGSYGTSAAAGIVGRAYQDSTNIASVTNCKVINTSISGYSCVGGIIGVRFSTVPITNCELNSLNITGSKTTASIIGADINGKGLIENVIATEMTLSGYENLAGLAGTVGEFSAKNVYIQGKFKNNDNAVTTGATARVAGYIGADKSSTLENMYVDMDYSEYIGENKYAVAYYTDISTPTYTNCIYVKDSKTPTNAFGLAEGLADSMNTPSIYVLDKATALTYGTNGYSMSNTAVANSGITFTSDDTNVVTVAADGTLTPAKVGTANITAKVTINQTTKTLATIAVTVEPKEVAAELNGATVNFDGNAKALVATVTDKPDDLTLVYSYKGESDSEYTNVAPTAAGTYAVKVESGNPNYVLTGTTAASLTINTVESTVEPDVNTATVTYGDTITLTANIEATTTAAVAFALADPDTVEFYSQKGYLGEAKVVYDEGGASGTAILSYNTADKGLVIGANTVTAVYGGSVSLNGSDSEAITITMLQKELTVKDLTAADRVYDGTTDVTLSGGTLDGVVGTDEVTAIMPTGGTVETADVGDNKIVTFAEITLGGEDAGYYTLVQPTVTVNITAVPEDTTPSTSTSGGGFSGSYNYPVTTPDVDNGDVKLSDSNAIEGESVTATITPDNGYGVAEVIVTDEDGNIIPVEFVGNGQYTFVMPDGEVSIEVICKPAITMSIGDTELNIFGKIVKNDVAPTIGEGNRTMLPIRAIANALGAEVYWDADNQKVTIVKDGKVIEVFIGKDYALVDGERIELDAKAYIENSRTYLQVRFVTEALDAEVIWDPVTRTVTIIPE